SSIDNSYSTLNYSYQNNTYYRLVLEVAPDQTLRAALLSDNGTQLAGRTFAHGISAFPSGFRIGISQVIGTPPNPSPVDVAVDFVKLVRIGHVNQPPVADASATVPLVISGNGTNAETILDGSRSSDPEGDLLQY